MEEADVAVGVPEMAPVEVEKVRPVGTDGEIDQDVAAPPEFDGVKVEIAELTVPLNVAGE